MSTSKKERSLLTHEDRKHHNLINETNQQQEFVDFNNQLPYVNGYWYGSPPPAWDPSIQQQIPYNYYPPVPYYYQENKPSTPVLNVPANKPTTARDPAPFGHTPQEITYSALGAVHYPAISPRRTVAVPVPVAHHQPPPPPHYYPRSPPHYSRRSPSPHYYSRRSPSPHYYYERERLPYIRRRDRRDERDYYDRYRHEDPIINGYMGRRHHVDSYRYPHRWYE